MDGQTNSYELSITFEEVIIMIDLLCKKSPLKHFHHLYYIMIIYKSDVITQIARR